MFALVDANNFYCSVERSFDPTLTGKPLVVVGNNDRCIIARSAEAKAIEGIKMGVPIYQVQGLIDKHQIQVRSANFTLYGDTSSRLMSLLNQFVDDVEVYSIDEAFLLVDGYEGLYPSYSGLGKAIRETIQKWLRLPVCVGFGATKTLAKVANRLAKKNPELGGVCVLDSEEAISSALATFDVSDLWGVGYKSSRKLRAIGVQTALQLRSVNDEWINRVMTVNGLRLAYELRGMPRKILEVDSPPKQSICSCPSFRDVVPDQKIIADALSSHLARCCEKLRKQDSLCGTITVFLHTNKFRRTPGRTDLPSKQYYASRSIDLPHPTSTTAEILRYALEALDSIFAFGYTFKKTGVILSNFVPADYRSRGIFTEGPNERLIKLAGVVDKLNYRFGQDKLRLASQMFNPDWPMKREWLSKRYTTRWDEILVVN
ncbi:Y-family DNA polymerase [Spirosoma sp. RP8]|uniref:Y-family DNA polymerase n=1 Tax=Spirosoma liriopis TaxID=2937440 RepID=A0ABT0HV10_9BACT|nr:Y-family DNA polymerase [Spirosoma liriopis]MCK8496034.1 Y-family DNA polymerase [Spirosoma liriopis]